MVTSEELNMTFQKVGNDFGFENVEAEFAPFRDLKIKWVRTVDRATFDVSDYLREAPESVIENIAAGLMTRMRQEGCDGYSEDTKEWLTSHEFRMLNQDKYVERSRTVDIDQGNADRLWDSYHAMVEDGLIPEIDDLQLFWSKGESVSKAGQSSCLMRTIIMNRKFMDERVPNEVLEYCLLHELANIIMPFGMDNLERNRDVNELANRYPGALVAKKWLDQVMMEV